jgi:hypothetical protein
MTTLRRRYAIRCDAGFLAASYAIEGPPVKLVPNAIDACRFVDFRAAGRRAQHYASLGWQNLRIVEFTLHN